MAIRTRDEELREGIYNEDLLNEAEANTVNNDSGFATYNADMLTQRAMRIGKEEIAKAMSILTKYNDGKATLSARIKEEEDYFMLQWNKRAVKKVKDEVNEECPTSAWLFNCIANKHADAMDSYPEPICLPREASDQAEADKLGSILPVVYEQAEYEQTYSDVWWYKLKHGTGVYSVMWNPEKENGLGNVDIGKVDLLNIFWEPGIKNIQDSPHLFTVERVSNEVLQAEYPHLGNLGDSTFTLTTYNHDESDNEDKSIVVDWYYKKKVNGKSILHYCKFVGNTVLYASENEPEYAAKGYYAHGKYPFVFDGMFPDETSPAGFGLIAISRDPQTYIDLTDKYILDYAKRASRVRWVAREDTGINEDEFTNWNNEIVHCQGNVDDERFRQINIQPMSAVVFNEKESKIDELKETSGNRDFSNGSTASGVTSGAAIATLQEAGNKLSRDMVKASYRAFRETNIFIVELIREFYREERSFRITAPNGIGYKFINYNSEGLQPKAVMVTKNGVNVPAVDEAGEQLFRLPIIDIEIKAQKQSPFTTQAQNETAMNLYNAGFFEPERAQQALICLEMMTFEGKEKIVEYVTQGQTLFNQVQMLNQQIAQASAILAQNGINPATLGLAPVGMPTSQPPGGSVSMDNPIATSLNNASDTVNTPYTQKLLDKASANG